MATDPLTGVYSRATLEQRLHEEIERAQRYDAPFSMILLDLDHFKSVNDAFGHTRGDKVLQELAERLVHLTRKSDIVFRYGGDEFLILLPNASKSQAMQLGERLLEGIHDEPFRGKPPISITISMGVASFPEDGQTPEALFEKSDQRHYEAKRYGRGRAIGDDPLKPPPLIFDEESRLVERDEALLGLHRFLKGLPIAGRGLLVVTGPIGSGRTRFLSEAGKVARLQGYEVIALHSRLALKNRAYAELSEVVKNWDMLPAPSMGVNAFASGIEHLIEEKGRTGLMFIVDDLLETDWPTLELLRQLLIQPNPPVPLALAFSAGPGATRKIFPLPPALTEYVEIGPLSLDAFRIWLRLLLKWEAPTEFTNWLYGQTHGLPAYIKRALVDMIDHNWLEKTADGWVFHRDLSLTSISESLGLPSTLPQHNLPATPTRFVGREDEIREAKQLLEESRLLTLVGPGGVGKTRLGIQVATEVMDKFSHGVYWVPLAAVSSPEFIVSTLAAALRFSFYSREDPEIQLFHYLHEKEVLLVMDNFEHLTSGAGLLARLMEEALGVKFLVTSRERLNIRGEATLELQGMSFPSTGNDLPIEGYSAIQLFLQSARRSQPNFSLQPDCKSYVTQICQMVEGLPLGIELAAAWVRVLSCGEIAAEIAQNLDFLTTQMLDVPERHRSLRAVFEHSWNLLLPIEQAVLRKISVFEGGFRREAAEFIAGASLIHLSNLIDKTLLRRSGAGRFELHEVLRQYAMNKLQELPEEDTLSHCRHSEYFAGFLQNIEPLLQGERQKEALENINEEIQNVRTGWQWAVENHRIDLLSQQLESLFTFLMIRGVFEEGESIFQNAANNLTRTLPEIENSSEADLELYARLLVRCGALNFRLSRYDQARDQLERGLEILRTQGSLTEVAFALSQLSKLLEELGEYGRARQTGQESLDIYKSSNDASGIAQSLNDLGAICYQQGEYQRAEQYHKESLRLFRRISNRWGLARALINLGNVESELGDYQQARQYYQESLVLSQEIGSLFGVATTLNNIGDICREIKKFSEARDFLQQSIELYNQIGDRFGLALATCNLGLVAYLQGHFTEAQTLFTQSLRIAQETGNRNQAAYVTANLGRVACQLGDYPAAQSHFLEALEMALENQAAPFVLEVLIDIANLLQKSGNPEAALEIILFSISHPALMKSQREEAEKIRAHLAAELLPEKVAEYESKNYLRPLQEVVDELIEQILDKNG